jgi:hypothetical protein
MNVDEAETTVAKKILTTGVRISLLFWSYCYLRVYQAPCDMIVSS